MTPEHVAQLIEDLIALFDPVVEAIDDVNCATALLKDMGYQAPRSFVFLEDFSTVLGAFVNAADQATTALSGDTEPDYLALFRSLIAAIYDTIKLIRDIGSTLHTDFTADFLAATNIVEQFPRQLADYLIVRMMERQYPVLHSSLVLIGLVDEGEVTTAATPFNTPYTKRVIRWEKLSDYLNSPLSSMQVAYGWNTDDFEYDVLIGNVHRFAQSILFFSSLVNPAPATLRAFNGDTDVVTDDNASMLSILKFPLLPVFNASIGVEIYPVLNATKDKAQGLGLGFYFDPSGGLTFSLTDDLSFGVMYTGTGPLDAGVVVLPGRPLQPMSNVFGGTGPQVDLGSFIPEFVYSNSGQKTLLFDSGFGAKLEFASWAVRGGALAGMAGFYVESDLKGATFSISARDGDGFLQAILPSQPMALDFDLTVGFSSKTGLYFGGSVDLDIKLPVHVSIGPVTLQAISVALKTENGGLPLTLGADISGTVGPFTVVVQELGALVSFSFPPSHDGNLGPLQVDLGFKPPSGVGLSIDDAGVSGGGFLGYSSNNHEYSGVLQLKFNDLELQAFGLITTEVAGGAGYSLFALVDANFPPVQLGWGFTLNGVGGLLAVHRSASADALRAAVKAGKLTFLFPKNAITSAAQILGQIDTLFPTAPGRFLFGPMAEIGWGTPTVLTASLALIVELPEPIQIVLIADIEAKLPDPSAPLIHLNIDALGVLDLSQGDLSLDASLFDSKLITYAISGDMALRANWSSQREFLLAVGGFHPQFTPPPDFPALKRVTIDMPSGIVSKLRLAAYLALTSNSVQFGATLDVFIGVSGCGLTGHLGFDALLQLDPFHFSTDVSGSVAITAGGDDLASVALDATLSGPAPWNIAGSFSIHLLFFDVGVSFSQSWGLSAPAEQPASVDVGALLATALADPRNWNSQLPAGLASLVTTREVDDPSAVFAHPLALLEVHEQVVPLDLTISRFGQAVPSGATNFSISDFRVGSQAAAYTAVQDDFAPAQFFDLSDADKLSRPSFERHDAGAIMSGNLVSNGSPLAKTIDYETNFIDTPGVIRTDEGLPHPFPWSDLAIVMRTGAAAQKTISRAGSLRFANPGNPIRVAQPAFALADTVALTAQAAMPAGKTTYSDVVAALAATIAATPARKGSLQVLQAHELALAIQ